MFFKKRNEEDKAKAFKEIAEEESRFRSYSGPFKVVTDIWLSLIMFVGTLFILGLQSRLKFTVFPEQWVGAYMAMFLSGVFLFKPATKKGPLNRLPWYDAVLAILSLFAGFWITVRYPSIAQQLGAAGMERLIFGGLTLLLLLEAIRRMLGKAITVILVAFLFYGKYSEYFPGMLTGVPTTWTRYVNYMYLDSGSLIYMLKLAANIGLGFIFFSQVLLAFGGADGLTNIAFVLFGRTRGGPAKAAVVGSSLVGTITGAPMANVFLTGSITIPMMIRTGWAREKAGAIEAVASSGGSLMPPVMGIGAFLIAERLGISYGEVAKAALIPALLFYLGLFMQVDLLSGKFGLKGLKKSEIPDGKKTLRESWCMIPIFALLIYLLFFDGMSAQRAAILSSLIGIPLFLFNKEGRKDFFKKLFMVFRNGGITSLDIGCAMSAGGIIVGVVAFSGLGFTFGYILNSLARVGIFALLLGAAGCTIILGMGMPAVAAYALTASLMASSLVRFGIAELGAHLFIFYFAILSNITPPIAMAVFAAITLSKSEFWATGIEACKLGILAFIVPFLFVFSDTLLMHGSLGNVLLSVLTAVVGTVYIAIAQTGYLFRKMKPLQRIFVFLLGVMAVIPIEDSIPIIILNIAGVVIGLILLLPEIRIGLRQGRQVLSEESA